MASCDRRSAQAYTALVGAMLIQFTIGTIYSTGSMAPYIISYFRFINGEKRTEVNTGLSVWIFVVAVLFQSIGMIVSGYIVPVIGTQLTLAIGCFIFSLGVCLTGLVIQYSIIGVFFTCGVLFGFGLGLAYASSIRAAVSWGKCRDGIVTGMIVACFGLGSLIFGPIQSYIVNPKNLDVDITVGKDKLFSEPSLLNRLPMSYYIMGGIYAAIQIFGCMMTTSNPDIARQEAIALLSKKKTDGDGDQQNESHRGEDSAAEENVDRYQGDAFSRYILLFGDEMPLSKTVKQKVFWKFYILYFLMTWPVTVSATLYKAFGETFIHNDRLLSILGALGAICQATGRLSSGFAADRMPIKYILLSINILNALLYLLVPSSKHISENLYFILILLCFFSFSGIFVLFPIITARIFGDVYFNQNYGLLFTAKAVSGILTASYSTFLLNVAGWWSIYSMVSATAILSIIIICFTDIKDKTGRSF